MRGLSGLGPLATAGLLLLAGCESPQAPRHSTLIEASAPRPAWLPSYTPEQRALLASDSHSPVTAPAVPTYPALDSFQFAKSRPFDPDRARQAARLVEVRVRRSPVLYVVFELPPRLSNPIAQYGPTPPAEPDPWVVSRPGVGGYEIAWARPGAESKRLLERANRALAQGDTALAEKQLERAQALSPKAPGLLTALGSLYAARHDDVRAVKAARTALRLDSRFFDAHLLLAEVHLRQGRRADARDELAEALASYPPSRRATKLARRLGVGFRPSPPPLFTDVSRQGAVLVGTVDDAPSRTFALCHAAVRHESELRHEVLDLMSYQLSLGEELFCNEALLGAYLLSGGRGDGTLDTLLAVAEAGRLTGYALFEVIGERRPEWLKLAPDTLRRETVEYIRAHVLLPP